MSETIKIVIADDHGMFRDGFKVLVRKLKEIELIGEAENGTELLNVLKQNMPDVILTDIRMPEMDGIQLTKKLIALYPKCKVIALTTFNEQPIVEDMLAAGAKGYLLKNTDRTELLRAIKTVHAGGTFYASDTHIPITPHIYNIKESTSGKKQIKISDREKEIMRLICKQYTNKEIAASLGLSIKSIETHKENIMNKTGTKSAVGVAVFATMNGIFTGE